MLAKVLTVDDSNMIQTMYRLVFRKYDGCRVTAAQNGREALDQLAWEDYDLILLDVNMPVMSGIEFLRHFQERGRRPPCPVIVISTEGQHDDIACAMDLGASAYLVKPFKTNTLHELIEKVIGMEVRQAAEG